MMSLLDMHSLLGAVVGAVVTASSAKVLAFVRAKKAAALAAVAAEAAKVEKQL